MTQWRSKALSRWRSDRGDARTRPGRAGHAQPANPAGDGPAASPLWRLWGQARGVRARLLGAAVLGGLASGCAVGLMATSAWLIARAAQQPPVLYLMVAVVAVRTFGIGRGVLRYLERLVSHDAAFRVLGRIREKLVAHLAVIAPAGLPLWRKGDLLARTVDDVDDAGDAFLRGLLPLAGALLVGGGTVVLAFLILPAAGIALAAALVVACVGAPADHGATDGPHRTRGRRAAGAPDQARHRDARRTGRADGARGDGRPARRAGRHRDGEPPGAAGTARAAGLAAGLAVPSMGAAVWLAAQVRCAGGGRRRPQSGAAGRHRADPARADRHRAGGRGGRLHPAPIVRGGRPAVRGAGRPAGDGAGSRCTRRRCPARRRAADLAARRQPPAGPAPTGTRCPASIWICDPVDGSWCWVSRDPESRPCSPCCSGFLTPTAGTITIDGIDVAAMDPDEVRTLFAWCDQRAHLFDSTLAENIRLAMPAADDERDHGRAAAAGAGDWLDGLPDGSATPGSASTARRCPVANASGSRWPGRCSPIGRCCWPTSRPRTSIRRPRDAVTELILRPGAGSLCRAGHPSPGGRCARRRGAAPRSWPDVPIGRGQPRRPTGSG